METQLAALEKPIALCSLNKNGKTYTIRVAENIGVYISAVFMDDEYLDTFALHEFPLVNPDNPLSCEIQVGQLLENMRLRVLSQLS